MSQAEKSPARHRSRLHRALYGSCLVAAGLFLAASIMALIVSIVAAVRFFSGSAE